MDVTKSFESGRCAEILNPANAEARGQLPLDFARREGCEPSCLPGKMGLIGIAGIDSEICQRVPGPRAAGGQEALQAKNAAEGLCAVAQMLVAVTAKSPLAGADLTDKGPDSIVHGRPADLEMCDASRNVRRRRLGGG